MALVYVVAIHTALLTGDPIKTYSTAYMYAELNITKRLLTAALDTNYNVKINDLNVETDGSHCSYVGIAFQNAFYQLMKAKNSPPNKIFYNAMIDTLSLGGDTNTNCEVAGALIGACFGLTHIPLHWTNTCVAFGHPKVMVYPPANHNKCYDMLISEIQKLKV